ncbi:MAG: hypothetical protein ACRDWW_05665 [Acidimicrobiales bacterium]
MSVYFARSSSSTPSCLTTLMAPSSPFLADRTDYGSRGFSIRDFEGNRWSFGTCAGGD